MANNYRYSDYSLEQLRQEIGKLKEKAQRAEQLGNISEVAVNERKMQVALAYTLNPEDFNEQETYELKNDPGFTFKINYMNGVFAWGNRINLIGELYEKEEAIPISLLGNSVNK
ncbi:MAG: YfhH family protein [Bacillota bacterium]|uniref:YfhH family protein n=1 Tax=Virgibacillus TaxID=84406 RepID=UPI000415FA8E|nr:MULTISPECIES: YfhH family protein [Bacillaceae]MCC2252081.1 YfhH family protein [Virgibacillus sp. AGTR]MDY7045376.1 YfhH family protein [Virgibacillus sp. M23]